MIGNISKSKGFKGDAGPVGPAGPQGIQGEKGDTPSIVFRYDEKTGNLYCSSDGILIDKEYIDSKNLVTKDEVAELSATPDWNQNAETANNYIKHRTHYAEETLICDFSFPDSYENEDLTVNLSKTIDLNKIKAFVNGKPTAVAFDENSEGAFDVQLLDTETGEELVWLHYSHITWPDTPIPNIYFQPFNEVGDNVKLYEENVVTLDEKYLPDSVPTMINYDDVLLCEYTYDSADFVDDTCPTIAVRRIPNRDKIKFYVNGEQVDMLIQDSQYGSFYGCIYIDGTRFRYFKYWAESGSFVFYNKFNYEDGTVVQIREDGVQALEKCDIPYSIPTVEEVDKKIQDVKAYVSNLLLEYSNKVAPSPASITLYADRWEQNEDGTMWYQEVAVANATITEYSKIDLQLSAEQITVFYEKDLAFVTENEGGVVTVYCIGRVPENDYVLQATVSEVLVNGE